MNVAEVACRGSTALPHVRNCGRTDPDAGKLSLENMIGQTLGSDRAVDLGDLAPVDELAEPYLRLRATSGWQALILSQLWRYRDLLTVLAGAFVFRRMERRFADVI